MRVGLYKVFDATSLNQYVRELVAKIDGTFPHEELRAALASPRNV